MFDPKKAVFAFITIVVVPALFFVLLELSLVVFGVGKSFDYFNEIEIDGKTFYQENPDFADQFYPPSLNIGPLENTFAKERDPDLLRVFILGGSAAQGFPHKNHGFDRLLAAQLRAAFPDKTIEVINTAMTSVNSHVVYAVANSIPAGSADFAVILMGNNEVVGPYGPGTFNQNFIGNLSMIRGIQSLKRTRLWQGLSGLLASLKPDDAMQELEWQGMQMFTNHGVPYDDPRLADVYSHYESNLTDIIDTLDGKGMHVILSSVPVNLRHSAPFLSVHDPSLTSDDLDEWASHVRRGAELSSEADWAGAIREFETALTMDSVYADTHFRIATAYENAGDYESAKTHYVRALELDGLRFRADTQINGIIRDVASDSAGDAFSYVDTAGAFETASQPYQPGWNLLLEHVHYDFAGNHVVAAEVARSIVEQLRDDGAWEPLSRTEVASRVGFPNHDTIGEIQNLQGMTRQPPFPGQGNYADLQTFLKTRLAEVTAEVGSQSDVVQRRRPLVRAGLADWKVHFELAVLNQRLENPRAMYYHLIQLLELYPHNRESYMKMTDALGRDGRWQETIPYLERSLSYTRGDESKIADTINWLGTAYLRIGDYPTATDLLLSIPNEYPDQIGLSLRAYGNLIRYTKSSGNNRDLERYIDDLQDYADLLVRTGKDQGYPLLSRRMSQILTLGGADEAAAEWEARQAQ